MQGRSNRIKSFLEILLFNNELDLAEKRKRRLFIYFQSVSIPGFFIYALIHIFNGDVLFGCINLLMIVIMVGAIVILKMLKRGLAIFRIVGLVLTVLFLYWIWVGAAEGNAIFWTLVLPLYYFHYLEKKEGFVWTVICLLCCLTIFNIPPEVWSIHQFSRILIVRFISVYLVISIFTYHYELIRERFWKGMRSEKEQLLAEKEKSEAANEALIIANQKLENEMNERKQAEIALQKARDHLESRVEERTMELMRSNEDLHREIEERSHAEENLRNSEESFSHLANMLPQTIFEINQNGKITYLNLSGFKLSGYTQKDLEKGLHTSDMFVQGERRKIQDALQTMLNNKLMTDNEFTILTKSGKIFPVLIYARRIKRSNKPEGLRGIIVNITQRKEIEHEIINAKEVAEKANIAKNNFLANMSHELRTPMNGVLGLTELLLLTTLTNQQREYMEAISHSGTALLKIMNDILDLSRIEAKRLIIEQIGFELRKIIKKNINLFFGSSTIKGLSLSYQIQEDIPEFLIGDPIRLGQVLSNTISNAVKFTEEGEIKLSIILAKKTKKNVILRFEITDTGIGITEDSLPHIFQSFTQADNSPTRKYGGAGLGLTIVKNIIDLMDGKVGVESQVDRGTTVWFELGYSTGKPPAQEANQSSDYLVDPSGSKTDDTRLLVVDDDVLNRLIVTEMLKKLGYLADASVNGKEALNQLKKDTYSLVFMDCLMPEMDGYETTRRIRTLKNGETTYEHIPVIALTAKAMEGDKERCLEAGMDDYLTKPVSLKSLKKVLEKHLF